MNRTSGSLWSFHPRNSKNTPTEVKFQRNSKERKLNCVFISLLTLSMISIHILWILHTSVFIICKNPLFWFDDQIYCQGNAQSLWSCLPWELPLGWNPQISMVLFQNLPNCFSSVLGLKDFLLEKKIPRHPRGKKKSKLFCCPFIFENAR